MDKIDCIVVGAGVIGLAIARALAKNRIEVIVLEAESAIGTHSSSRNSEVIHAGIYYPDGSLKQQCCLQGKAMLYEYCRAKGINHKKIGKLILATSDDELKILHQYRQRAAQNSLHDLCWLEADEVLDLEPAVRCKAALLSPSTGIIDSHEYMLSLRADIEALGGAVICRSRVTRINAANNQFVVQIEGNEEYSLASRALVNSAGLWAPAVAASMTGIDTATVPQSFFAKGQYYALIGKAPFNHLIYPVAGKAGLGVHLTLDLAGQGRFGPDVQWIDGVDYSFNNTRKQKFINAIRSYYPNIEEADLAEGYTGIRPKLCGPGERPADFLIQGPEQHKIRGLVNLFGIESPGLTSSLAIADRVAATLSTN